MKTKKVKISGVKAILLRYQGMWVYPEITWYSSGLGSPVAVILHQWKRRKFLFWKCWLEEITRVTVNIPDERSGAGRQFIDTNNNGDEIIPWLEENGFGHLTGHRAQPGYCTYPEFDFYKGEMFHEYREVSMKIMRKNEESPLSF